MQEIFWIDNPKTETAPFLLAFACIPFGQHLDTAPVDPPPS